MCTCQCAALGRSPGARLLPFRAYIEVCGAAGLDGSAGGGRQAEPVRVGLLRQFPLLKVAPSATRDCCGPQQALVRCTAQRFWPCGGAERIWFASNVRA